MAHTELSVSTSTGDPMTQQIRTHVREHASLLAAAEARALIWMAERLPRSVGSDHLTVLGLAAMVSAGAAYWVASAQPLALWLVVVALGVNWFGDSLDGTVARVRNQQRPMYGYYVDHVIDIIGALFLLGGLALSGYMTPLVALGLLIGFLMLSAETYLATHACGIFRISLMKIGPTELRIVLAIGTVYLLYKPWVVIGETPYRLFDVGGVVAIAGMGLALTFAVARNTRDLYRAEPLPRQPPHARPRRSASRSRPLAARASRDGLADLVNAEFERGALRSGTVLAREPGARSPLRPPPRPALGPVASAQKVESTTENSVTSLGPTAWASLEDRRHSVEADAHDRPDRSGRAPG
jgi:archaetidylinositol phosphate synthase